MDRQEKKKWICLPPHTWLALYLVVASILLVVCGVHSSRVRSTSSIFVAAAMALYIVVEIRRKDIKWSTFNLLIMAMASLFLVLTILRRDYSNYSRCNLVFCLTAFAVGISPGHFDREDAAREARTVALVATFFLMPFVLLALISVFTARPIHLLGTDRVVGIRNVGMVTDRIWIVGHPNCLALMCVVCLLLALYAFSNVRSRWLKVALIAASAVFYLGIVHAQCRSASIVLGLAIGALGFRWVWRRLAHRRATACIVGLLLVAASILLCIWLIDLTFTLDVQIALRLNPWIASEHSTGSRIMTEGLLNLTENGRGRLWKGVLKYLRANPLTLVVGLGAQQVYRYVAPFTGTDFAYGHLHNSFIEVLVRGGLPMLAILAVMLVKLVRPCLRQLLAPASEGERMGCIRPILVGVMLVASISEAMLFVYTTFPNILFFIMCSQIVLLEEKR